MENNIDELRAERTRIEHTLLMAAALHDAPVHRFNPFEKLTSEKISDELNGEHGRGLWDKAAKDINETEIRDMKIRLAKLEAEFAALQELDGPLKDRVEPPLSR